MKSCCRRPAQRLRNPRLSPKNPSPDYGPEPEPGGSADESVSAAEQYRQALKKSLDLLSRRDHASAEIRQKLATRDFGGTVVDSVLEYLYDNNYLNDTRFAESFLRMRVNKGFGERDIRARLSERGVSKSDINAALDSFDIDWYQCAADALHKKFRHSAASLDPGKLRERGARFLQARGFSADQTFSALDALAETQAAIQTGGDSI